MSDEEQPEEPWPMPGQSAQWPPPWPPPRPGIPTAARVLDRQRKDHAPGGLWYLDRQRSDALAVALPPVPETERNRMATKDELWPSKYLKAADFPEPRTLVIKRAKVEELKNKDGSDTKLLVEFEGEDKKLVLNRTNFDGICDALDRYDSDEWPGHRITLYPSVTSMNGREVPCVRVRKAAPAKPKSAPAPVDVVWDDSVPALGKAG
jgi:hypothetical protein